MDVLQILRRLEPNAGCTKATCDASRSVYGYIPSLAATVLFLVLFALSGAVHTFQGIKRRSWFFMGAMLIGCLFEVLGYVAKLLLYRDPFSKGGFQLSIVVLTVAPAFYSAGIYYILKHIVIIFGATFSRLRPSWYTWVFIGCDLLSIILQAVGGGTAAAAKDQNVLQIGDNILIAGLAFQVVTLFVFGLFAMDYAIAARRHVSDLAVKTASLRKTLRFRLFLIALTVAYVMILMRCAYRVAELAKGWGKDNYILRNQALFIGLDSVPCAIATILLNIWHPSWCLVKGEEEEQDQKVVSSGSDDEKAMQSDV